MFKLFIFDFRRLSSHNKLVNAWPINVLKLLRDFLARNALLCKNGFDLKNQRKMIITQKMQSAFFRSLLISPAG